MWTSKAHAYMGGTRDGWNNGSLKIQNTSFLLHEDLSFIDR